MHDRRWILKMQQTGFAVYFLLLVMCGGAFAAEKWSGVDEAVVQKIAAAHGRTARPILDLEGDAQLFAFLVAGAVGGFAAGYWWRMLVAERRKK